MSTEKATVSVRNGTIYVQAYIEGVRYRKSTRKKDTKANLAWVRKNAYDVLLKLIDKQQIHIQSYNLQKFGFKSLEMNTSLRKANTNAKYLTIFKHYVIPYFGKWQLEDIKPSDLKQWQTKLIQKGLTGKSVKNIRGVFRGILQDAFMDEIIHRNPFDAVRTPKTVPTEIEPFSLDEIELLISSANEWFSNYLTIAFFTGMRIGEIIGLRWEDINFHSNFLKVKRNISNGIIDTPKTAGSIREIEILPPVKKALKAQFALTGLRNDYVFLTQYGKHYQDAGVLSRKQWKPLIRATGLNYRVLYQTRHTFASMMLQQGEELAWVSEMMGHTNINTTLAKYTRFMPRKSTKRALFLDDFMLKVS
jgi:integrase